MISLPASICEPWQGLRERRALFIGAQRADLYHWRGGALAPALENVAYFYTRDAREAVARLQSIMEPLLTLALGGLIGWVVFSVLGPVYDLVAGIDM